jgi:hypothetical protein
LTNVIEGEEKRALREIFVPNNGEVTGNRDNYIRGDF